MGEISENASSHSKGRIRSKKMSTRIDMTPMVDLAFLLLTFFILTSSFIKSSILPLTMPEKDGESLASDKNILNLVLAEDNKVYWWDGLDGKVQATNYSSKGIRELLLNYGRKNPRLIVLIKPSDKSKYENLVDVLDEIAITNTQRYSIVDYTKVDAERLKE